MRARRTSLPDAGFTLAEVLVALVVVAVGMVGAAGLQAHAARLGRDAAYLSAGTQWAASLAERMRANPVAMALPDDGNPYLQLDYDAASGPPAPVAPCYGDADCTPAQLAALDLSEAAQALADRLPGARVRVCRDAAPAEPGSGLLRWSCDAQAGAPLAIKLGWRDGTGIVAPRLLVFAGGGAP